MDLARPGDARLLPSHHRLVRVVARDLQLPRVRARVRAGRKNEVEPEKAVADGTAFVRSRRGRSPTAFAVARAGQIGYPRQVREFLSEFILHNRG